MNCDMNNNALSDDITSGRTGPAYDGEYYTPTFRLAMWHAIADTRGSGREKKRLVIRPLL